MEKEFGGGGHDSGEECLISTYYNKEQTCHKEFISGLEQLCTPLYIVALLGSYVKAENLL